jgi:hypothetical protein
VPVLRRKLAGVPRTFVVPGGSSVPLLATAVAIWLLSGLTQAQAIAGGAALAAGLLLWALARAT